jgi:uncharacterized repeat protein (TIGR01451 family)
VKRALVLLLLLAARLGAVEGFESNLGAWTAAGLWHRAGAPGCVTPHAGVGVAYYGRDGICNYDTHSIKDDSLTSGPVTLSSAATAFVSFWLLYQVESLDPSCYDQLRLEKSFDGVNWSLLQKLTPAGDPPGGGPGVGMASGSGLAGTPLWQFVKVDLSAFAPGTLYLRFRFVSGASLAGDPLCGPADSDLDNFLGIALDDLRFGETGPALTLNKSVSPAFGIPGSELTYTLVARNDDPASQALSLWDSLPNGLSFVAADNGGMLNGGRVDWGPSTVAPGANWTVQVRVQAAGPSPADLVNAGEAGSTAPGGSQQSSQVLFKVRDAGIHLQHSATPSSIVAGDQATYNLTVENDTALTQTALSLTMTLPSGLVYNGAWPAFSGSFRWDFSLMPGEIRSFSLWGRGFGEDGTVLTAQGRLTQSSTPLDQKSASVTVVKPIEPAVWIKAVYPNPAPSDKAGLPQSAFVYYETNTDMPLQLDIFNVAGEKVRSLPATGTRGRAQVEWDLKNDWGAPVASGVYVFRLWSDLLVIPTPEAFGYIAVTW